MSTKTKYTRHHIVLWAMCKCKIISVADGCNSSWNMFLFFFLVVQVQRCLCVLGKKTPLESICEKFTGEVVCACVLCYHDHCVVVVCAPTIVSWRLSWLFVLRPSCRGDAGRRCQPEMWIFLWNACRYPERSLRLPKRRLTSVPANSGTPYVPFLAKVMPKIFVNFGMTLLKKGHMGYCD